MRICTATGPALLDTRLTGYRIAKCSSGPLSPRPRPGGQPLPLPRHLAPGRFGITEEEAAALTGESREATTLIAQWIREQVLDKGTYPAGVRFHSQFGGGTGPASWMRRTDDGLGVPMFRPGVAAGGGRVCHADPRVRGLPTGRSRTDGFPAPCPIYMLETD